MKRFVFPLQKVLRFKTTLLEEEKNRLMQYRGLLGEIERQIEENLTLQMQTDDKLKQTAAEGANVMTLQAMNYSIESSRRHAEVLEGRRKTQQQQVDQQLAVVVEMTQEVSGLERLRDKQYEEYQRLQRKADEELIGELVSGQYAREGHSQ